MIDFYLYGVFMAFGFLLGFTDILPKIILHFRESISVYTFEKKLNNSWFKLKKVNRG